LLHLSKHPLAHGFNFGDYLSLTRSSDASSGLFSLVIVAKMDKVLKVDKGRILHSHVHETSRGLWIVDRRYRSRQGFRNGASILGQSFSGLIIVQLG
jgi:hypothetical protein